MLLVESHDIIMKWEIPTGRIESEIDLSGSRVGREEFMMY